MNQPRADILPCYNKTLISGASADTTIKAGPGILARVLIHTVGAGSSTVSLYDGAVSGTAFAVLDGTTLADRPLDVWCRSSIHVKTVDSGGAMRVLVTWR